VADPLDGAALGDLKHGETFEPGCLDHRFEVAQEKLYGFCYDAATCCEGEVDYDLCLKDMHHC
jgi:hypothetical protein